MTDHFSLSAGDLSREALPEPGFSAPAEGLLLETPRASAAASPAPRPTPREKWVRLSIEVPPYVAQALKQRALDRGCSVRHVMMLMMRSHKIPISDADMCEDGRKANRRKS